MDAVGDRLGSGCDWGGAYYFLRPPGQMVVRTIPLGVQVVLDGRLAGTTSDSGLVVEGLGAHFLEFSRDGFETDTTTVHFVSGQVVALEILMHVSGMVLIRGGAFEMGWDGGAYNERPAHRVDVSPFLLNQTEVTVAAFTKFKPNYRPSFLGDDKPATNISWQEAFDYCKWAGKRLPTEAEWERACRGDDGRVYNYGDVYDLAIGHTGKKLTDGPVAVESLQSGDLTGMTGNVWEWCADWYDRDYYRRGVVQDPQGPKKGAQRVLRGGAWYSLAQAARCTHRAGNVKKVRDPSFGFRCARDLEP